MGRYRWTGPRAFHDHMNDRVIEPDAVAEVDDDIAERFDAFEAVDEDGESGDSGEADPEPTDGSDEPDATDEPDSDGEDAADSEEAGAFDAEAVREEHWQTVVNAIEAGEYDGHLDELAERDDRKSVQEAIDSRQTDG